MAYFCKLVFAAIIVIALIISTVTFAPFALLGWIWKQGRHFSQF